MTKRFFSWRHNGVIISLLLFYKKITHMKNLCLFLVLAYSITAAQTMHVSPMAGSQSSYSFADIQKLTFDNGKMLVTKKSGISDNFTLSELRYINFTNGSMGTTYSELATDKFYAYPHPANYILNILASNAMQRVSQIKILSSEGRLLMQEKPAKIINNNP
jgi:hypothetical protein